MSTKIGNGLRFDATTLRELTNITDKARQILLAEGKKGFVNSKKHPAISAVLAEDATVKQVKNAVFMSEEKDYDTPSLVIFNDFGKDYILAVSAGMSSDDFLDIPGVSEYAYWNNADHPDDISEQEWDARGEDWSSCVGYGPVKDYGMIVNCPFEATSLFHLTDEDWGEIFSIFNCQHSLSRHVISREATSMIIGDGDADNEKVSLVLSLIMQTDIPEDMISVDDFDHTDLDSVISLHYDREAVQDIIREKMKDINQGEMED